jgi:nicotinamide mononucleotide transporter
MQRWHAWGEPLAVALSLAYTIGYMQGAWWAFACGGLGAAILVQICWQRRLLAESALWLFYVGMAAYGAWVVQDAWPNPLPTATVFAHGISIGIGIGVWMITAGLLQKYSHATSPWMDSFTTIGSLVATYWMFAFVEANWLYWMVINTVAIVLYARKFLRWGAGLYFIYTLLAIEGWFDFLSWI